MQKSKLLFLGTGQKLTSGNSELSLPSNSMRHRKIPTHCFCPVHKSNNLDFTLNFLSYHFGQTLSHLTYGAFLQDSKFYP